MTPSDNGLNDPGVPLGTVMKSLKNSTGGEECSTNRLVHVFSSLGPVLEELRTTDILLQSQPYPSNQKVDMTQDRHCAPFLDLSTRSSGSFPSNSTSLSSSISPSSSSTNVPKSISLFIR